MHCDSRLTDNILQLEGNALLNQETFRTNEETNSEHKTLMVFDGTNLLYRSYHALRNSGLSVGSRPVWAVHGLFTGASKLIAELKPDLVSFAFDMSGGAQFRRDMLEEYKATRKPPEQDLAYQLNLAPMILQQLEVSVLSQEGMEADDMLASAVKSHNASSWVVTSDRDAYQLVTDTVKAVKPDGEIVDVAKLRKKYGLTGSQYADLAALRGEPSDNIPGVPLIGEKTAMKLLKHFKTLENILEAPNEKLREHVGPKAVENIKTYGKQAVTAKKVGLLVDDLFHSETCKATCEAHKVFEPTELRKLDANKILKHMQTQGLQRAGQAFSSLVGNLEQPSKTQSPF